MDPLLAAEKAIGIVPVDLQGRALHARFVAGLEIQGFHGVAILLGKPREHAQQHGSPVLGFRSAGAGMEREDGVVRVIFLAEQHAQLQMLQFLAHFGQGRVQFGDQGLVLFLFRHAL